MKLDYDYFFKKRRRMIYDILEMNGLNRVGEFEMIGLKFRG